MREKIHGHDIMFSKNNNQKFKLRRFLLAYNSKLKSGSVVFV